MPQSTNQVLALVKAKWLEEAAKDKFAARWIEFNNGKSIKRDKDGKRTELCEKHDGIWLLLNTKYEDGKWVANPKPIITIQSVVEKVYEAWLVARVKKPAETVLKFSRRWGRLYEGTRIEDTKFIIATIKQVEAELAARDTLNPKTKSKSKKRERARFPEVVDATAAVSAPDPVPNADSKSPARKRTKQSSISEEASASEDTTNKLAVKKPDVSEQHSPEFLADAFEEPATISKTSPSRNVAPIETNTSLGLPKPTSLKDTAPPLTQNSRASGRRPAAQYITVGEPTMTQEIDEEGRTIITYDHSQQRTYRVMSGSLIGAPSESEIAPKAVRNPDPTKNAPKGPRADDHYRPNYLPGYQPNYQSGYGTRREHRR